MLSYCPFCMEPMQWNSPRCPSCGKIPEKYIPSRQHLPPRTLLRNRYAVGMVLSEGKFDITYLCRDMEQDRKVAIREFFPASIVRRGEDRRAVAVYKEDKTNLFEKNRSLFLEEGLSVEKLNIPELVGVLDVFPLNNTCYQVLEYVTGVNLGALLNKRGPVPPQNLLQMMEPLLRGIQALHNQRILHLNITPDNILMLDGGHLKLLYSGSMLKPEGGVSGANAYLPPELDAERGQGPWSDVYMLCATMYRLLTGRSVPPASARSSGRDALSAPSRLGIEMDPEREQALMKGLAFRPTERWRNISELYKALYTAKSEADAKTEAMLWPVANVAPQQDETPDEYWGRPPELQGPSQTREAYGSEQRTAARTPEKKKKKSGLWVLPVLLVLALGGGWLLFRASRSSAEVTVTPATVAKTYGDACGKHVTWSLQDGTLVIAGTGEMYDFQWDAAVDVCSAPWWNDRDAIRAIDVRDGVTGIGSFSFYSCGNVSDVSLAGSVTKIGPGAFSTCRRLTGITLPGGLKNLGDHAFFSCGALRSIVIPAGVTELREFTFSECINLTEAALPDGLKVIGTSAFNSCQRLSRITLPESLNSIGSYAFNNCANLTAITIPGRVKSIGTAAFSNCKELKTLTLRQGLVNIGNSAFSVCKNLKSVEIPDGVKSIDTLCFHKCTGLESVTLPASLESIGGRGFNDCDSLKDVYYHGTSAQWNKLRIQDGNNALTEAALHFTEG